MKIREYLARHLILTTITVLVMAISATATWAQQEDFAELEPQRITYEQVADGLTAPVALVSPADDDRRFIADLTGIIYILTPEGELLEEPFLDLRDQIVEFREDFDERGLLALEFHPNYAENGRFFVHYSAPLQEGSHEGWDHTSRLSEFRTSEEDPNRADPESERIVLQVDQPQFNHNGGGLAFGSDGYLYIALGDGGDEADTGLGHPFLGNGQDITTILGNILRIDVEEEPYGIPEDNPFVDFALPEPNLFAGDEVHEEIFAWGVRNPFRMSFDQETGDLYVGDAGQELWECIYLVTEPGNYGWRIKECSFWFDPGEPDRVVTEGRNTGPLGEPLINPIIEYAYLPADAEIGPDPIGLSTIGGHLYRGQAIPELQGRFVFGDWSRDFERPSGVVAVATPRDEENELWPWQELFELDGYLLSIGRDAEGELYLLTNRNPAPFGTTGVVYKIVPQP